jgi:O-antigen ligase
MSGPNQLGIWLSLPLGALLASWESFRWKRVALLLLLIALLLTFSRSAWIAAAAMLLVVLARLLPRIAYRRFLMAGAAACVLIIVGVTVAFPSVFFRLSSTRGHFVRPLQAASLIMQHPFGLGLGSAGPATNRVSETCVFLRPQDDPSWAKSQPSLCVFLGATQVQPKDHACHCPYLPENWYLQIGVELGVLGFALFLALTVLLLQRLWHSGRASNASFAVFLSFLGICIAALFLHAWEDAAVAYTGWLLAALALPVKPERAG